VLITGAFGQVGSSAARYWLSRAIRWSPRTLRNEGSVAAAEAWPKRHRRGTFIARIRRSHRRRCRRRPGGPPPPPAAIVHLPRSFPALVPQPGFGPQGQRGGHPQPRDGSANPERAARCLCSLPAQRFTGPATPRTQSGSPRDTPVNRSISMVRTKSWPRASSPTAAALRRVATGGARLPRCLANFDAD